MRLSFGILFVGVGLALMIAEIPYYFHRMDFIKHAVVVTGTVKRWDAQNQINKIEFQTLAGETVFERENELRLGSRMQILYNPNNVHEFIYYKDAGRLDLYVFLIAGISCLLVGICFLCLPRIRTKEIVKNK